MHTTEQVWVLFSKRLLNFIRQRVSDPAVANDLLQDVFLSIHLHLATLSDADKLTSWVYQIARNRLLDYHRAAQSSRDQPLTTAVINETGESLERLDYTADLSRCLRPFMEQMDEIYRDALWATDIEGVSQKAYAQQTGLSYSAAKSRVQRARRQLHGLLTACCRIRADRYGAILDYQRRADCPC